MQLIPDVEDVETWEDLLEDEEIAWDPFRKRLLTSCPSVLLRLSPAHAPFSIMDRKDLLWRWHTLMFSSTPWHSMNCFWRSCLTGIVAASCECCCQ